MKRTVVVLFLAIAMLGCRPRSGGGSANSEPRVMPSGAAALKGPLLSYADVVDRVAPAVVTVDAKVRVRAPRQFPFFEDPFFRQFFGGQVPRTQPGPQTAEL